MFKPTHHFLKRWTEFFPDLNWERETKYASRPGNKIRRKIKKQCPQNRHNMTRSGKKFYLINRITNIVFVCSIDRIIVTVFPYENGKRKERFFGILQKPFKS